MNVMKNLNVAKALVVLNENNENVMRSARNVADVKTALVNTINVYDILKYNTVVATKAAVAAIEEVYAPRGTHPEPPDQRQLVVHGQQVVV